MRAVRKCTPGARSSSERTIGESVRSVRAAILLSIQYSRFTISDGSVVAWGTTKNRVSGELHSPSLSCTRMVRTCTPGAMDDTSRVVPVVMAVAAPMSLSIQ